ncbi:MAG: succinylglutamate desuccinylase [Chloroflexi bacterium]|nr:succinylglutamate desuccinylase [Chloroflexota bacterium]
MTRLNELIEWESVPIPAGAAVGSVPLMIGRAGRGAPVVLIAAGVHGDEGPWGAWAIHKLLTQTPADDLLGSLRVVPAANPLALEADARNAPLDTLDLNRTFPGSAHGSHTERLAATLVERALPGVDVVIDLHGGGSWCVNAFAFRFAGGEALSEAFAAPFIVDGPERQVTLTGYARSQGARAAAIEMGGRGEHEVMWAARIAAGLRRALGIVGVLRPPSDDQPLTASLPVGPTQVLRPSRGGVFVPELRGDAVGTVVAAGTTLGYLHDPATMERLETFTAPFPQTALLLLRPTLTRIEGGAMTYVIAEPLA